MGSGNHSSVGELAARAAEGVSQLPTTPLSSPPPATTQTMCRVPRSGHDDGGRAGLAWEDHYIMVAAGHHRRDGGTHGPLRCDRLWAGVVQGKGLPAFSGAGHFLAPEDGVPRPGLGLQRGSSGGKLAWAPWGSMLVWSLLCEGGLHLQCSLGPRPQAPSSMPWPT